MPLERFDCVFVGGGLASGLAAMALRARRPAARLAVVEAGPTLGGNHTWSFHDSDLDEDGHALCAPLVTSRWNAVDVRFTDRVRTLATAYSSIPSARFAEVVARAFEVPGSKAYTNARAAAVGSHEVVLADGRRLDATLVVDARGPQQPRHFEATGFQKFLGLEVEVPGDILLPARPVIMDATVEQIDGYRFVYTLPLGGRRLLVEDTYYSDQPTLDEGVMGRRIHAYLDTHGWGGARVLRREAGVLTIPFGDDPPPAFSSPVRLGYAGGWFHPTTGFSLPTAVRVASALAAAPLEQAPAVLQRLWRQLAPQRQFARLLNKWLFRAVAPDNRAAVFSRFYGLPRPVIERFYAGRTTALDRVRVLTGRPPRGVTVQSVLFPSQAV